ncbi:MAG: glutamine--fructose-6-phosphate transaminase (isomerizing) [Candidatus Hermodarchaeia archaeon]
MCGIIGAIHLKGNISSILRQSLKRLEYRGYDSSGIATLSDGVLYIKKDKGKIDDIHDRINFDTLPGSIGIGHTRWATHGPPSKANAHPHTDCQNRIAVVHNGIIENYQELREQLLSNGHHFRSQTDTEVIPHLIEDALNQTPRLDEAVAQVLPQLEGSYAIVVLRAKRKELVCARKESPLVIGLGSRGVYCASDVPAFLPMTRKTIILEDDELVHLTSEGALVSRINESGGLSQLPIREPITVKWTIDMAQKGGYPHFMLKEIHEQPRALGDTLRIRKVDLDAFTELLHNHKNILTIAAGTSYHATLAAKYMFSQIANQLIHGVIASEGSDTIARSLGADTAVLAVTQSGETIDTLHAVKHLKNQGATILAITNTVGSSITRLADSVLYTQAGPEIGVAATKTYATQLATLALLSISLGKMTGAQTKKECQELHDSLNQFPRLIQSVIRNQENIIKDTAQEYITKSSFFFLGRGISTSTAMEGALKIKEIAYVHAEGYPAGESKHGPIALVEPGFPIVFVAPNDNTRRHLEGNVMEMKARGAQIISICSEKDQKLINLSDHAIALPALPSTSFSPISYAVPLQLLAYYAAILRGHNPDQPRNLAKAVTVL